MNLALFDFDGTITSADTFTKFVFYAVSPLRLAAGMVLLSPLILAYKLRLITGVAIRSKMSWLGFAGWSEEAIKHVGAVYARDEIPKVLRPQALERLAWHKQQGDRVVVVSASLDVYLAAWCKQQNLELICTNLEIKDGVVTGQYVQGDCCNEEKPRRILEQYRLGEYPVIYAYGDTAEDLPMLDLANKKVFRWTEVSG